MMLLHSPAGELGIDWELFPMAHLVRMYKRINNPPVCTFATSVIYVPSNRRLNKVEQFAEYQFPQFLPPWVGPLYPPWVELRTEERKDGRERGRGEEACPNFPFVMPRSSSCLRAGILWPVECIPYPLRYVSLALPQTYASEALRCIMYRGNVCTHHRLTHTHTHTLIGSRTHTHTHITGSRTLTHTHSQAHAHSHTHTHTHTHRLTHTHTHTHTHRLTHTHTHTHTLTGSRTLTHTHSQAHTHSHSHTHTHRLTHTHTHTHTLTGSRTLTLTHTHSQAHAHSHTHTHTLIGSRTLSNTHINMQKRFRVHTVTGRVVLLMAKGTLISPSS